MTRYQGYRFRLRPTKAEAALLKRFLGCSRFLWNEVLAQNEIRVERGEKRLTYKAMYDYLIYLKAEYPFLRESNAQALQQTLRDLHTAYRYALDPKTATRFPRFKKKTSRQSVRFPQGFKINGKGVYLPKVGWIGFRKTREIQGTPKNVTVLFDAEHWFVAIQTEREVCNSIHCSTSAIGIDVGIARFAALSDGTYVDGANAFRTYQKRLAFLQRRLSRRVKFSANWRRAKAKITRLQRRIANMRNDTLHKASTTISKNHAVVVMEDLRITNMAASAKGTRKEPGNNVRAKSNLNRRILDQAWGEFRRQLGYKMAWRGGALLLVNPRDTSCTCARCGFISRENRRTQSTFCCMTCGHMDNADTNAAINILRRAGYSPGSPVETCRWAGQ